MDRKLYHGIHRYKHNTGRDHSLSMSITPPQSRKRGTGSAPLTDYRFSQWYFTINIGLPFQSFAGMVFLVGV
jgi:hypothetical protein